MKKLLSVSVFSSLLAFVKMLSGFIISKVVAVHAGPSGLALLGQIQSFVISLNGLASSPVTSGLVKFTSEHYCNDYKDCSPWWRASLAWSLAILFIIVPVCVLLNDSFSIILFNTDEYHWVILLVALSLPFTVFGAVINSVTNGLQQYRRYIFLGFISVVVMCTSMVTLVIMYGIKGALASVSLNGFFLGFTLLTLSIRNPWLKIRYWFGSIERSVFLDSGKYVFMAVVSALCLPTALIIIRNMIANDISWIAVGEWQAIWKISEAYLSVITIGLSTYYLPKLSRASCSKEVNDVILGTSKLVIPVVISISIAIYLLRDIVIAVLFTKDFYHAGDLFKYQFIGNTLKIASWLISFVMLAKAKMKLFIFTEIISSFLFVILSYILLTLIGLQGVVVAYTITYGLYLLFLIYKYSEIVKC